MGEESGDFPLDAEENMAEAESESNVSAQDIAAEGSLSRRSSLTGSVASTDGITDDSSAAAVRLTRTTEEEDLDYDEDSQSQLQKPSADDGEDGAISDDDNDGDGDARVANDKTVEREEGEESSDGKDEGELEDGELTDSDGEVAPSPPKPAVSEASSTRRRSRDWTPPLSNKPSVRQREKGSSSAKAPVAPKVVESAWERGLREAREAMRRATKVREDPDFESKRLTAAPSSDRSRGRDTDSDGTPRCSSRSLTPQRIAIPSLLEIRMSPPRLMRNPPKARYYHMRNIGNRSRSSSASTIPYPRAPTPVRLGSSQRRRRTISSSSDSCSSPKSESCMKGTPVKKLKKKKHRRLPSVTRRSPSYNSDAGHSELGPQVIYPNGRPNARRGGDREPRDRPDRRPPVRRETPPGPPPNRIDYARGKKRDSPRYYQDSGPRHLPANREPVRMVVESTTKVLPRGALGLSPARDASPISSDSDMDIGDSTETESKQKPSQYVARKPGGAMDAVNDPWARKKKSQTVAEKAKERLEKKHSYSRSRSSSTSSSDDNSNRKDRKKRRRSRSSSSSSSNSARSRSRDRMSSSKKSEAKVAKSSTRGGPRSPPTGDISSFRIPKKRSHAGLDSTVQQAGSNGDRRRSGGRSDRVAEKASARNPVEEFFAKKPEDVPAAFRRSKDRSRRHSRRSRSRSSSSSSSSSSNGGASDSDDEKRRGLSPSKDAQEISDSDGSRASKRKSGASSSASSRSRSGSRSASPALPARYRVSSKVEDVDLDAERQQTVSPVSDDDVHLKNRNCSASPQPPPPPTPPPPPPPAESSSRERVGNDLKSRVNSRGSGSASTAEEPQPKKQKSSDSGGEEKLSAKERRRRLLLEQLREVESELKKRAVENAPAH